MPSAGRCTTALSLLMRGVLARYAVRLLLANFLETLGQGDAIQFGQRQAEEQLNAVLQPAVGMEECLALVLIAAFDGGRILDAPVRGDRLARPHRAHLAGRVVANGEDEVEF